LIIWGKDVIIVLFCPAASIIEILLFEYTILGIPDTFRRRSSEYKYRPCWYSVGGEKDGELLYICCLRWHSIIKPSDFNLVTFFTSPAQLLMHFSITKGDIFVSGTPPSLLFNTINRDQLSETALSSSYLASFFLFFGGIYWNLYLNTK
jgi:hypothetical protein